MDAHLSLTLLLLRVFRWTFRFLSNEHIYLNSRTCAAFNKRSFENPHRTEPIKIEDSAQRAESEPNFYFSLVERTQTERTPIVGGTRTEPNSSSEGSFPSLIHTVAAAESNLIAHTAAVIPSALLSARDCHKFQPEMLRQRTAAWFGCSDGQLTKKIVKLN